MYENYVAAQSPMAPWEIIVIILVICTVLFMVGVAIRAIGVAFLSRKDERMKSIVRKSMAQAFGVLLILHTVQLLLKIAWGRETYHIWWRNFTNGIYIEPVMLSMIILGVLLLINERRHS